MAVWLVRTGFTDVTLQHGIIVAGWDIDLSGASSYEDVLTLYQRKWPNTEESSAAAKAALLWDFLHNIKVDDLILMPRDWEGTFSVGRVTGQFQYVRELKPGARMTRPVRWLDQRVPVAEFDREIIDGLRPQPSIQEVRCHNADQRVLTVLERQPIQAARHNMDVRKHPDEHRPRSPYRDTRPSLESCAWNQIREAMWHAFPGAELLRLLDGLLKAQGYQTSRSPTREPNSADLLAEKGSIGSSPHRLLVRVLAENVPPGGGGALKVDLDDIHWFEDAMQTRGVPQGILVAWHGFQQRAVVQADSQASGSALEMTSCMLCSISTNAFLRSCKQCFRSSASGSSRWRKETDGDIVDT